MILLQHLQVKTTMSLLNFRSTTVLEIHLTSLIVYHQLYSLDT